MAVANTGVAVGRGMTELALLRLVAQRLAGPRAATSAEAVRWLTAMQAQDLPGAFASVALRTAGGTRAAVEAALEAGEIVRSWPMRGTLHFVPAEDLPWLLALTASRPVAQAARRRAELGLDPATLERARVTAVELLAGDGRLPRAELLAAWEAAGLVTSGQRGYHMLAYLAQTGTLCLGPMRAGEQLIVLVDEWIPRPRRLEREEALGELATRYFRGHGPATVKDFTRWTGLLAADVRAALALARPRLARLEVDGAEHLLDPDTPELLRAHQEQARSLLLLPGFDELVLGYADRSATLPVRYAQRVVPGGNGVFQPTVVSDGLVIGTWRRTGRGADRGVTATPFEAFPDHLTEAIDAAYGAWP